MPSMCHQSRLDKACKARATREGLAKHAKHVILEKAWQNMQSVCCQRRLDKACVTSEGLAKHVLLEKAGVEGIQHVQQGWT